ncbi:TonB-dependent receptor [Candidatus Eisenbacteria bacterium]|uniref:TonB-dependent receptor n=1 Tax=Eiseniibacteriota bacterium TaxID=2212470 RepID=A0ABV6YPL6_UNCEI
MRPWLRILFVSLLAFLIFTGSIAYAQEVGRIAGTVTAKRDGRPLSFANVLVMNTGLGTFVKDNGGYAIDNVPVGAYTVKVMMMGFAAQTQENVVITANSTSELNFQLSETVVAVLPTTQVTAVKPIIDTQRTGSTQTVDMEETSVRSINTVEEAIAAQAGVILEDGEIHIRGGRSGEVKTMVDGMQITDAFVGNTGLEVSLSSLSEIEVLSGGFDAEYGNVQSGIINLKTREGGPKYSGVVKFMTDDYGSPDKTYFNFDNLSVGFGGPLFTRNLRFFVSAEVVFSDTYLKTLEPRQQKELWGIIKFRERQTNNYSLQGKATYIFPGMRKLSLEFLGSGDKFDFYHHAFSRVGYWSDTQKHWWFEPLDSTYSLYYGPAHTPDITNNHKSMKMVWNHTLSPSKFYTMRFGRYSTVHEEGVLEKRPDEYVTPNANDRLDPENRYFVVAGDYPHWQHYESVMWTGKGDMTIQKGQTHQIKFGLETNIYQLDMTDMLYPDQDNPTGSFTDIYDFNCWQLSAFLQDRIKFEGMNVRAGLRFDLFDPGKKAVEAYNEYLDLTGFDGENAGFFSRTEWQVSPRLGVSYPISERDALYFNYGRFYQIPRLEVMFQFLGRTEQGLLPFGNPLMDAETTIMYEVGVQHQFTGTLVGDIAMFYKDIFGLTGTLPGDVVEGSDFLELYGPTATPVVYTNLDYGSVRGIEFKLSKRFSRRFAGSVTYTFSKATGSSSNELQGSNVVGGGLDRAPITELPLDWDRNHVVSANLYISEPGLWGCNLDYSYSTGRPFTPVLPREREVRAALINSERLDARSTVNVKADKRWRIGGQEISLFMEGRNVLDRRNISNLSPGGWPGGDGNYSSYYTTESELGGAYDEGELLGLPEVIYVPLNDPRVYSTPRNFRVGISFDW